MVSFGPTKAKHKTDGGHWGQALALVGQHHPGQLGQLVAWAGGSSHQGAGLTPQRATHRVALWGGHPGQQTPKGRRG